MTVQDIRVSERGVLVSWPDGGEPFYGKEKVLQMRKYRYIGGEEFDGEWEDLYIISSDANNNQTKEQG